jgi:signal transduction histidine kinase
VDPARTGPVGRRGTGLGLAIVKHGARSLGGSVGLRSVWREGTTVWIEIPVGVPARGPEPGCDGRAPEAGPPARSGIAGPRP